MQLATAPPEWLEDLAIELTDLELVADLEPNSLRWDPTPPARSK